MESSQVVQFDLSLLACRKSATWYGEREAAS